MTLLSEKSPRSAATPIDTPEPVEPKTTKPNDDGFFTAIAGAVGDLAASPFTLGAAAYNAITENTEPTWADTAAKYTKGGVRLPGNLVDVVTEGISGHNLNEISMLRTASIGLENATTALGRAEPRNAASNLASGTVGMVMSPFVSAYEFGRGISAGGTFDLTSPEMRETLDKIEKQYGDSFDWSQVKIAVTSSDSSLHAAGNTIFIPECPPQTLQQAVIDMIPYVIAYQERGTAPLAEIAGTSIVNLTRGVENGSTISEPRGGRVRHYSELDVKEQVRLGVAINSSPYVAEIMEKPHNFRTFADSAGTIQVVRSTDSDTIQTAINAGMTDISNMVIEQRMDSRRIPAHHRSNEVHHEVLEHLHNEKQLTSQHGALSADLKKVTAEKETLSKANVTLSEEVEELRNQEIVEFKYVVKDGDNLSKLAEKYLADRMNWGHIFSDNYGTIGNDPNKIRSGQELFLRLPRHYVEWLKTNEPETLADLKEI